MCSFPYTAAVKTVQALWPKLFFSSKKIFIPFVQSDRQQRFCAAFLQFLRYFKSAVQLHLPCPVAVFESGGWRMITSSASVLVSPRWSSPPPPPPPSSPGDGFEERMSPGTDCLTSEGPELGTATIRTLRTRTAAGWTGNHTHPVLGLCPGGKVSQWVEVWKPQKVSQRKLSNWDLDSAWTDGFWCELVNWACVNGQVLAWSNLKQSAITWRTWRTWSASNTSSTLVRLLST